MSSSACWLRAAAVLDGRDAAPRTDTAIRVEDGVITDVVAFAEAETHGEQVLEFPEGTLAPGYIDSHVHLVFDHGPDHESIRDMVEESGPDHLALVGARSAFECLLAGITTVRDCGDRGLVTLALRDAIADDILPGPRILAAGPPVTITSGHLHWCGGAADSPDAIRARVRELCMRGVDHIKVMASGGYMTRESNVGAPQFSVEELRVVVEEAHRLGRRVAAHASNTEAIRRSVRAGIDTIEHCLWRGVDGQHDYDPQAVEEMVRLGTWVDVTIADVSRQNLDQPGDPLWDEYAWARRMREAGVSMFLSSDAGVRNTPFRRFDETVRCAVEGIGITYPEALVMATSRAAEAIGLDDEIGSIEVGHRADLMLLDAVVSADDTRVPSVRGVWRDGRALMSDGVLVAATTT